MSARFFFLVIALIVSSSYGSIDRCQSDRKYRKKICTIVQRFLDSQTKCDIREIARLRRRVAFLQGILSALVQTRSERNLVNFTNGCPGTMFRRNCFFLLDQIGRSQMKSHQEARAACGSYEASLAVITSRPMYDRVYEYIATNAKDIVSEGSSLLLVWTGASYSIVSGELYSENNNRINFVTWGYSHPTNTTERNRIALAVARDRRFSGMFDVTSETLMYPLCQKRM